MKEDIVIDFMKDNYFTELKETEVMRERMNTLQMVDPFVGKYYSVNWVRKNVLFQTEEEIEEIDAEIGEETAISQEDMAAQQEQQPMDQNAPPQDGETGQWPNN